MAIKCRELETGYCEITQGYSDAHRGIDIVGAGYTLAWVVAHSDGTVVAMRNNCTGFEGGGSYGNFVKIKHDDGYYTLYAHGAYNTMQVSIGQRVSRGQKLFYMGATGTAYGGHLHWEVRNPSDVRIDPNPYLDADLPGGSQPTTKYKIGDVVNINGVYVSSTSTEKLMPAITRGTITRIINGARNPYLLDDGNIGWVNDDCIIKEQPVVLKTVANCYWLNLRTAPSYGDNIYTAVQAGTQVEYLGMEAGWAKIKYDGRTLYCGSSYLN